MGVVLPWSATGKRRYGHKNLYAGANRRYAKECPEAWKQFKIAMRRRLYGDDELNDAWMWFLKGWVLAGIAAEKRASGIG